jgi:hypothetical protein
MKYDHQHEQTSVIVNVEHWLSVHSPRMLTGLRQWLCVITVPISEQRLIYHLPVVESSKKEELSVVMWMLSGLLPVLYLGALQSPAVSNEVCSSRI